MAIEDAITAAMSFFLLLLCDLVIRRVSTGGGKPCCGVNKTARSQPDGSPILYLTPISQYCLTKFAINNSLLYHIELIHIRAMIVIQGESFTHRNR